MALQILAEGIKRSQIRCTRQDSRFPLSIIPRCIGMVCGAVSRPKQAYQNSQILVTFANTVSHGSQSALRVISEQTSSIAVSLIRLAHCSRSSRKQYLPAAGSKTSMQLPGCEEDASCKYRMHRNVGFVTTLFRLHEDGDGTKLHVDSCERRLHLKGRATGRSSFADSCVRQNG